MRLAATLIPIPILLVSVILFANTMASTQLQISNSVTITKQLAIDHVIVIMLENRSLNGTLGIINNNHATYINSLIKQYGLAAEFYDNGVPCGSISSYIAITNGDVSSLGTSNCGGCNNAPTGSCIVNTVNIGDRLETAGFTWKSYFEDMPSACYLSSYPANIFAYDVGHNPFVYYQNIQSNTARCQSHVIPAGDKDLCQNLAQSTSDIQNCDKYLLADLNSGNAPNYMWLGTNTWNNMYDHYPDGNSCTTGSSSFQAGCVQQGDTYLKYLVPAIMGTSTWTNGHAAIFLTWDEAGPVGSNGFPICPTPNPNAPSGDTCQIPAVWIGPMIKTGYMSQHIYSFYSFLKTIEQSWGLAAMKNEATSTPMTEFFK